MCHDEADDVQQAGDCLFSVAGFNVLDKFAGVEADETKTHYYRNRI